MTHRLFGIGATAAVVMMAAAFTIAQSPDGPDRPRGPRFAQGQAFAALDLTEDQRAQIATLHKQLADLRVKTRTAVAELLTPEQREKLRLMGGRRGGHGRGPGGHARGPDGPGRGRGRGGFPGAGPGGDGNAQ